MEPPPLAAKGALSEKGRCPRAPSVRPVPRTSGGSAAERPEDYGERPTLPASACADNLKQQTVPRRKGCSRPALVAEVATVRPGETPLDNSSGQMDDRRRQSRGRPIVASEELSKL